MSNRACRFLHTSARNVGRISLAGITRCAVSAVSVVLIAQMCRSCTSTTPGSAPRNDFTSLGSMPSGTASRIRSNDLRISDQVPTRIVSASTMLTTGSSHCHPVNTMNTPVIATPSASTASDARCRNALRRFRSFWPCVMKRNAAAALMTAPTAATAIIVRPSVGSGASRRRMDSHVRPPVTKSSTRAFATDATIVVRRNPNVRRCEGLSAASAVAPQERPRPRTSPKLCPASASKATECESTP